jgi:hypothetical protein
MERKEFLKYSTHSAGAMLAAGFGSEMSFASPISNKKCSDFGSAYE